MTASPEGRAMGDWNEANEFRPIPGYEGIYEVDHDGRVYAVERMLIQNDVLGRSFTKVRPRRRKAVTYNGNGYPAYNLNRDNRQSCRLVSTILRASWGREVPPQYAPPPPPTEGGQNDR